MKGGAGAKMSLTLLGLKSEIVAMVGMVDLYFSALGERESLSGSAMRFYFHNCLFLSIYPYCCFGD